MGWRKDLVEKVATELVTITELESILVFNEELLEGIAEGRIPRAPFAIVQYIGFTGEPLGEDVKRDIIISVLFGVCNLRGEQAAFKGDDAPVTDVTMDQLLEDFEDHFWGLDLGTGCPAIVGDESFEGMTREAPRALVFSTELIVRAIFRKK